MLKINDAADKEDRSLNYHLTFLQLWLCASLDAEVGVSFPISKKKKTTFLQLFGMALLRYESW